MLTEAELAEMLEIRRKIDALQSRYNELAAKMAGPLQSQPAAAANQAQPSLPQAASARQSPVPASAPQPGATQPAVNVASVVQPQAQASAPTAGQSAPGAAAAIALPADRSAWTLKDYIVDTLKQAGRPLSFDEIYKRLETSKAPLPKDKPMLVVRQTLYNRSLFEVGRGGLFCLVEQTQKTAGDSSNGAKNSGKTVITESQLFKYRINALKGGGDARKQARV